MKLIVHMTLYVFLAGSSLCHAKPDTLSCHGHDQTGRNVSAFIDFDAETMSIDGQFLNISTGQHGLDIITTENFRNENGVLVYDSVAINGDFVRINQYDACQQDFIVSAALCCRQHLDF